MAGLVLLAAACEMQFPPPSAADNGDPPAKLGSGAPPSARRQQQQKGLFDIPDEGELLKDGEETIQKVTATVEWLRTEGWDLRCGASVLGTVSAVFPSFGQALDKRGVLAEYVIGAWVVPPFIVSDLIARDGGATLLPWRATRGRMAPFLKNDVWRRIDAEVRQGHPVDWQKMSLLAENLVVVKVARPWRELAAQAAAQLTWPNAKRAARTGYALATRDNLWRAAVSTWPFKWHWLLAWAMLMGAVRASHLATAAVVPVTWHDVLTLWLANLAAVAYAYKCRAEPDAALRDA